MGKKIIDDRLLIVESNSMFAIGIEADRYQVLVRFSGGWLRCSQPHAYLEDAREDLTNLTQELQESSSTLETKEVNA